MEKKILSCIKLTPLDRHFVDFLLRLAKQPSAELELGAALVSNYTGKGHACVNLEMLSGRSLPDELKEGDSDVICPQLKAWVETLTRSGVVGRPGEFKPLIFSHPRLYLHRYWEYEKNVGNFILKRGGKIGNDSNFSRLALSVDRLFPSSSDTTDWQKIAALAAATRQFCLITGGPGTGKTTTVAKILALLLEQAAVEGKSLRILLSAPTGKAAARLQEALHAAKADLACEKRIKEIIPVKGSTVHRLLSYQPLSKSFLYTHENPLPADVVVVDEASMIDLSLMAKLMYAIPAQCRLILLGDRDQLASVEPGSVLGDVCAEQCSKTFSEKFIADVRDITGESFVPDVRVMESNYCDSIVALQKSYRFGRESGIGAVGLAVVEGKWEEALSLLERGDYADLAFRELSPSPAGLQEMLRPKVLEHFAGFSSLTSAEDVLLSLHNFSILGALRHGPYGINAINRIVMEILKKEGLINSVSGIYQGKPIMITENNYDLGLYNGDTGIFFPDPDSAGQLRIYFAGAAGALRKLAPARLPPHEVSYAVTVHKSQGSEYDHVLLILPDRMSKVLTGELVYTALTRAKKTVEVWGKRNIFAEAVRARISRDSGLRHNLAGKNFFSV